MYTPYSRPITTWEWISLSCHRRGSCWGMGSLPGAVAAGFLLGILQSLASMTEVKEIFPGIDQIIIT